MYDMNEVFDVVDVYYVPYDLHFTIRPRSYYNALYYPDTKEIYITSDPEEFIRIVREERERRKIEPSYKVAKPTKMLYTSDVVLKISYDKFKDKDEYLKLIYDFILQESKPVIIETAPEYVPAVIHNLPYCIEYIQSILTEIVLNTYKAY